MAVHYPAILPALNDYLMVSSDVGQKTEAEEVAQLVIGLRQSKRSRAKKKEIDTVV